jgi:hypothetical protein
MEVYCKIVRFQYVVLKNMIIIDHLGPRWLTVGHRKLISVICYISIIQF